MAEPLPLIVILGPTGAGKTALAMQRAAALDSEIVSADSVQVYRGLDIGSAKPTAAERIHVHHHLIDLWEPTEQANAGAWVALAIKVIAALHARGRVPVVCGGTGLYVRALLDGLAPIPDVPQAIHDSVRARLAVEGAAALHAELAKRDPPAAALLAPNDGQRVARALEVMIATGEPLSAFHARHRAERATSTTRYATTLVGVFPERAVLEQRIAERARRMVASGLVDEVRALLTAGLSPDAAGLKTMGYREVVAHLTVAPRTTDALVTALALAHRRYAKRQLTWWRDTLFTERVATALEPPPKRPSKGGRRRGRGPRGGAPGGAEGRKKRGGVSLFRGDGPPAAPKIPRRSPVGGVALL